MARIRACSAVPTDRGSCGSSAFPRSWIAWIGQALADAQALAQPFISAMTLGLASALHVHRGEVLQALERADASWTLSTRHGFPQWTAYAQMCRGWARVALGEADAGIAEMEQGWAAWQALGSQLAKVHATISPVGGGVRENGAHCGGPRLARGRRGACPHVPGMLPRGRAPSDTRRTAARAGDTAGGGGLSSSLDGNRSPPEGEIAGAAGRHGLGATLATPGPATGGVRPGRADIRLVHSGLRYARSAEGQGVAGRIGSPGTLKATSEPKANTARSLLLLPTRTAAETKYRRESIAGTWGQRPRHLGRHLPTV